VAAEQTIERRTILVLTARDSEVFVDAIQNHRARVLFYGKLPGNISKRWA
jgi:hypothetical protein